MRDYKTVCEKVSTKFLARLFCALLWFKELINRVLVYCVLPGVLGFVGLKVTSLCVVFV